MSENDQETQERPLISRRTLDIAVGIIFVILCAIVLYDSKRLGFQWRNNEGPAPGYFPFYIAVLMLGASLYNIIAAWRDRTGADDVMVTVDGFKRMSAVFFPALVYVFATHFIGIYIASAIYIAGFMLVIGKFSWLKSMVVSTSIALSCFVLFEIWFLVPLPKGPLETALGY